MAIFVLLFWKTSLSAIFFSQSLFYFSGRPVYLPYSSANLCFTFLEDQSICHILQPIFILLFWKTSLSAIFFSQSLFYFSGRPVYLPYTSANLCLTFLEDQSICHVLQPSLFYFSGRPVYLPCSSAIFVLLFWKTSLSAMFFSQSLFYFSGRPVYLPCTSANLCFTFLEDQTICHVLQPIRQVVTEDVLTLVCCILAI